MSLDQRASVRLNERLTTGVAVNVVGSVPIPNRKLVASRRLVVVRRLIGLMATRVRCN